MEKEEKLAIRLRDRWDINTHSPIDIFPLVLDKIKDLTLLWYGMDQSISGCCCKNDKNQIIMINSNHTRGRQNFTLAHELYHLFFDKSPNDKKFYMLGKLIPLVNKSYERGLISKGLMEEILIKNYRSDIVYDLKED
ncbi:MAG: ImmA/IrrE family metallo-endopeptidase [Methanobrevibacter sp.]